LVWLQALFPVRFGVIIFSSWRHVKSEFCGQAIVIAISALQRLVSQEAGRRLSQTPGE
jgi:hypothetical protein